MNKGINFALHQPRLQTFENTELKGATCNDVANALSSCNKTDLMELRLAQTQTKIMKDLREKPVFYFKVDKGNAAIIGQKTDYDAAIFEKLWRVDK